MIQTSEKKIHILHVTEVLSSYGGTPVKLLYQVLNSSPNFKYVICCIVSEGDLARKFLEADAEVIVLNRKKNYDLFQISDIVNIIKTRDIDIVHTHFARSNTFGRIAAILTGKPIIVSEHGILRNASPIVRILDNILNMFTFAYISNSNATMDNVQKKIWFNRKNMSVIYNGVPDEFKDRILTPKEVIRKEFGFCSDDFIILNIGGHIPLRDHETMIRAIASVRASIPNLKVVQIGYGKEFSALESEIQRLKLDDVISLWGYVEREKTHRFIRAADVYINAAVSEGFGIATAEVMLCEVPVICANFGALPELVTHDQEGFLFEPKNVDDLAEKIILLYRSKELKERLGKSARKKILEQFNIEKFINGFEEKYLSMIDTRKKKIFTNVEKVSSYS